MVPVSFKQPGQMAARFCFHRLDQDEPAQAGKDQQMNVLQEMNDLQDFENGDSREESSAIDIG